MQTFRLGWNCQFVPARVLDRGLGKIFSQRNKRRLRPHWFHCVPIGLSIPLVYLLGVLPTSVQPARATVERRCDIKFLEPRLHLRRDSIPATVDDLQPQEEIPCDRWGAGPAPTPFRRWYPPWHNSTAPLSAGTLRALNKEPSALCSLVLLRWATKASAAVDLEGTYPPPTREPVFAGSLGCHHARSSRNPGAPSSMYP